MRTARPGFWSTADHEAAKVFGRRFWRVLVLFRVVRAVWLPLAVVVFLALAAGLVLLSVRFGPTSGIAVPEIPEWLYWVGGLAILFGLSFFVRPVRWFWSDLRYRILP